MSEKSSSSRKNDKILYGIITFLSVVVVVMGFLLIKETGENSELTTTNNELVVERNDLEMDLEDMISQYDALSVDNEELTAEIIQQKEELGKLLDKVQKLEGDDKKLRWEIDKLKKEAGTLRDIMKGYLYTIDSLNQANIELTDENIELSENLSTVTTEKNQLQSTVQSQEQLIKEGKVIPAMDIQANALRIKSSGKQSETNRASRAEMIRTCCKLGENRITEAGTKTLHLRIISPEGIVLEDSATGGALFEYEGVTGKYSAKRDIEYNNQVMDACVFYTVSDELSTGQYIVEVYESGALIGKTSFDLR